MKCLNYKYIQTLVRQLDYDACCLGHDKDGNTPLHLAARVGNKQAIEGALLNSEALGSDVDESEDDEEKEENYVRIFIVSAREPLQ